MHDAIRRSAVAVHVRLCRLADDAGQTVAEYALVLLVAAVIAGALIVWAKQSGKLDSFFDAVFSKLLSSVDAGASPSPSP